MLITKYIRLKYKLKYKLKIYLNLNSNLIMISNFLTSLDNILNLIKY